MTSIVEKINFFKENLKLFDDDMDKYKYLLDQAKNAKIFPEEFRQESFKVDGCQAQVWLVPSLKRKSYIFTLIQMHLSPKAWSQYYVKSTEEENQTK